MVSACNKLTRLFELVHLLLQLLDLLQLLHLVLGHLPDLLFLLAQCHQLLEVVSLASKSLSVIFRVAVEVKEADEGPFLRSIIAIGTSY